MKYGRKFGLRSVLLAWLLTLSLLLGGCFGANTTNTNGTVDNGTANNGAVDDNTQNNGIPQTESFETVLNGETVTIPAYAGKAYVSLADGAPRFTQAEITTDCFEYYSELDSLGRCGMVKACCGKAIMPPEGDDRGSISSVYPSGWKQAQYDFVNGKYLYNRCHLIGWQLSDEDANEKNLITGTRYINIDGMLPFENMVADYIRETNHHVMYRVTPVYIGNELVPRGVVMEGYSVEDGGEGISFYVYCYNVQPGVVINYATGESALDDGNANFPDAEEGDKTDGDGVSEGTYVLNTNSKKIHKPTCSSASGMAEHNKREYTGDLDALYADGYTTCGICFR